MKRLIGLLMMLGMVMSVVGCGDDKDSPTGPTKGPQGQTLELYIGENEDGNQVEYQLYRNGNELIKHGFYKGYYESGKVEWEGNYVDGKKEGKWVWYYESGKVKQERNYVDGKKEGKEVSYDDYVGNIIDETCWEMGKQVSCP